MQNIYDDEAFFQGYLSLREGENNYNDYLELPAFRGLLPDLTGKDLIDLGCGFGDSCMYYKKNGAERVVGIDISVKMIEKAKAENAVDGIEYYVIPLEKLDGSLGVFDVVASLLAFHYVADYSGLVQNVRSLLKDGGIFIFSQEHPIMTANQQIKAWIKDENQHKLYWPLDHYGEEGKRVERWIVDGVVKYHRTTATLINTLIENKFIIEKVLEPIATEEGMIANPSLSEVIRRPVFLMVRARLNNG